MLNTSGVAMVAGLLIESRARQKLKKKKKKKSAYWTQTDTKVMFLGVIFIKDDILQSPGELKYLITER